MLIFTTVLLSTVKYFYNPFPILKSFPFWVSLGVLNFLATEKLRKLNLVGNEKSNLLKNSNSCCLFSATC